MVSTGKKIPLIPQILSYLTQHSDGANINEIAKGIGQGRDIVAKYLLVLNLMGRLELWTEGNTKVYRLAHRIPFHTFHVFPHEGAIGLTRAWVIKEIIGPVCELLGCPEDLLVGHSLLESIHPLFLDKRLTDIIHAILDGKEYRAGDFEGRIRECLFHIRITQCIFDDGSTGVALIFQDLTQDQAVRLEEHQLAERFRMVMRESEEFIADLDRDDRVIRVNLALARYWGMPPSSFVGTTGLPSVFSEDLTAIKNSAGMVSSLPDSAVPIPVEVRVIMSDGTIHWQEWRAYTEYTNGVMQSIHCIGSDITDLKFRELLLHQYKSGFASILQEKTEELREGTRMLRKEIEGRSNLEQNLKRSEDRYRRLTETISDIIWQTDENYLITDISNRVLDILGYEPEELIGRPFFDLIQNRENDAGSGDLAASLRIGKPIDRVRETLGRKDGRSIVVEFSGIPIRGPDGQKGGYYGIARDITPGIREEKENSNLRSIIEFTSDIVAISGPDGSLRYLNPAAKTFFGVSADMEIRQMNFFTFIPPEDHDEYHERRKAASDTGIWRGETVMLDGEGNRIPMSQIIHYHQRRGREPFFSTIARDISARIEYENELAQAYAYARTLIEMSQDILYTISPDGRIRDVNAATELATGFKRKQLIRGDFTRHFSESDTIQTLFSIVLSEGSVKDFPVKMQHRTGRLTPVLLNASAYRDDSGTVLGVFITIRESGQPSAGYDLQRSRDDPGKPPPGRRKAA